ncbi:DNA polymerase III subunit [Patulibacter defluvii]|uniref:DNA polymerase III subunit n=1 Tax=Patulibacter defluvii TaxID=3095358 RepID=UPI002A757ED0|nr:AAA family ATPase [Patulibacter sp. DM4]
MSVLAATEHQPHARAVLRGAFVDDGTAAARPSHAYLFQGPAGSGKRTVARALAAELLSEGAPDPADAAARVARGAHPDLTWVTPTGAAVMRREDIDETVVQAVSRRPFEARRRVFVLERAEALNDNAANRLLKTLEEPPEYVVLILLTDRPGELLPTIRSRCQTVRFDAAPEQQQAARLASTLGLDERTALACARLGLGDARVAATLAGPDGQLLRTAAEMVARHALGGGGGMPPWRTMADAAIQRGKAAEAAHVEAAVAAAEQLPDRERKRAEREAKEDGRRAARRERTIALDLALRVCGLWFRDVASLAVGAEQHVHHVDRLEALREDAARPTDPHRALRCVELVDETRRSLTLNASEELQLDALCVRLQGALGGPVGRR